MARRRPGGHLRRLPQRVEPGSSLGVAVGGSVLVAGTAAGSAPFLTAIIVVGAFAIVGCVAALLLPHDPHRAGGVTTG